MSTVREVVRVRRVGREEEGVRGDLGGWRGGGEGGR